MIAIRSFSRNQIATGIAILFHVIGITGILFGNRDFFIRTSFLNLMLMFALLLFTQPKPAPGFAKFIFACFVTGLLVELIGTQTGWLFGDYAYGLVLGPSFQGVPFIIGINWFIIVYCCGMSVHMLLQKLIDRAGGKELQKPALKALSVIVDGATLAVLFDWLMEPVAVKLGYWHWKGTGEIPLLNYASWFLVSALLLFLFERLPFKKENKFAIHLLLIQAMFFLILRTLL